MNIPATVIRNPNVFDFINNCSIDTIINPIKHPNKAGPIFEKSLPFSQDL